MLITHVSAARTRMVATTTAAIRPVETFDFEDVEVAAGNEDDVAELVALVERAELVPAVNDAEDVVVEEVVDEVLLVEVVDIVIDPVFNVGSDVSLNVVVATESSLDFFS
jgi:hypothetical protein